MNRDHIAIMSFFESRATGTRFVVVNVHTFANPSYADVKTIQTAILFDFLTEQMEKYTQWAPCTEKEKRAIITTEADGSTPGITEVQEFVPSQKYTSSKSLPLFVVGDFNSMPGSAVHDLLSTGSVPPDHPDLGPYSYGPFTRHGIFHPFSLKSAYAALDGTAEEVAWTNYTPGFTGILDYIWYAGNSFEVVSVLGGVDPQYMERVPGWPNWHFPSDHVSLLAEFVVKGTRIKRPKGASNGVVRKAAIKEEAERETAGVGGEETERESEEVPLAVKSPGAV
jgi:CCR4-NOT transcription complex subunit 6